MTSHILNTTRSRHPYARLTRLGRLLVGCALIELTVVLPAAPAQAAEAGWATFAPLEGSSRDYVSAMKQRPADFPAATIRTTSVGGSAVGVQGGNSAFLASQTPPGKIYGFNRGEQYLNLRPNGLSAARRRSPLIRLPARHRPVVGPSCSVTSTPTR